MFNSDYAFTGSHAQKVMDLTAELGNTKNKLFSRNVDVYLIAPIVGFLYDASAAQERGVTQTNILLGALMPAKRDLELNYQTIMLLDEVHTPNAEARIDKAFRTAPGSRAPGDVLRYEDYVRGGVDTLHKKLVEPSTTLDDYWKNLYKFLEEFNDRHNQSIENIIINIDLMS